MNLHRQRDLDKRRTCSASRLTLKLFAALLALLFAVVLAAERTAAANQAEQSPERGFVSSQPAKSWEDAMISGNGRHGALVLGQPFDETIILNHARLYLPLHPPLPPPDSRRIHVANADEVVVLLRVAVLEDFEKTRIPVMQQAMMKLKPGFDACCPGTRKCMVNLSTAFDSTWAVQRIAD